MAFLLVVVLIFSCVPSYGQLNETGTITGSVTDQSGAVVPGASVVIVNVSTGVSTPLKSNGSGEFTQVGLNVGNYSVKVSMEGFGTYEQNNFYLAPTSTYTVKVVLKPGETVTAVDVAADAVVTELTTSEISTEIPGKEANMLALNGRNYQELSTLMPGVVNLVSRYQHGYRRLCRQQLRSPSTAWDAAASSTRSTASGTRKRATFSPTPSRLRRKRLTRRKLLQNNYSVQYNMMGGAMFMVHTKSGTAQFHGQAWYFIRNGVFNALNYFYNAQQAALNTSTGAQTKSLNPPFRWNIGGLGLGGPLFIPHVYNTNRDKTFFYINGQYVKQVTYTVASATFPTADEINGIFPAEIHDPVTQNDYPVSPGGPSGNQWTIPQSKISASGPGSSQGLRSAGHSVRSVHTVSGQPVRRHAAVHQ